MSIERPVSFPAWDEENRSMRVSVPTPYEGVRRALAGSFGSAPAVPDEMARLLNRLR